ncbi:transposase [Pseudomonas synxantha]|uniref:Transposase-like protein n=1 Tax=Pseudomonas synxantha TaxID=47883 RepID=A0ACC6JV45_9PSED|nr:transposase [Pseudomonas synxantha]MDR6610171.1 transposase-like protein [Pseudomonas synxantha]
MRQRSSYSKPFKARVVQECLQPGATISSVAISHGINANVIRKWLPLYQDHSAAALPAFVPKGGEDMSKRSLNLLHK